jgi:hypothetical protein
MLLVMTITVFLDGAAPAVGQAAINQHLQQHAEDVGWAFSTFVEQQYANGLRRTASVKYPPSS